MTQHLDGAYERQAATYKKGRKVASYQVGDLVWRETMLYRAERRNFRGS